MSGPWRKGVSETDARAQVDAKKVLAGKHAAAASLDNDDETM
jgi:hypothetical protein